MQTKAWVVVTKGAALRVMDAIFVFATATNIACTVN
jgi:hypothetical protein